MKKRQKERCNEEHSLTGGGMTWLVELISKQ